MDKNNSLEIRKLSQTGLIIRSNTKDILKKYNHTGYITALVKDEIKCEGLTTLKRDEPAVLMLHIGNELKKISTMTGSETLFDGDVIVFITDSLLDTYGNYLNLPDISYAISKGVTGQYGKVYGKINAMMVLEWIMWYDKDKTEKITEFRISESGERKSEASRNLGYPDRSTGKGEEQFKESMRQAQAKYLRIKLKD